MLSKIDATLNRFTTYRVILYGLASLLLVAFVLAGLGSISISPGALAVSIIVLLASCYVSNKLFSLLFRVPTNTESWLISALILACILSPATSTTRALYIALAGVIAMASKYLIVYRSAHIFNPAAFGAFVVSIAGLLPATWWIATPWLTPFTVLLGLIVLRKQRRFQMFFVFAATAVAMLLLTGALLHDESISSVLRNAALSWPIIFFGTIMLTEPATLPSTRYYQILLAAIVGLLFTSQLHAGRLATTPQAVLLLGNLFAVLAAPHFGATLKLRRINQLSPNIFEAVFIKPTRMKFQAGQYMELTLPHPHVDSRGNRRTFSIASAPNDGEVRIAFRRFEPGSSFKAALLQQKPDNRIRAARIGGSFTLPPDASRPLLFIAGGIGVTPFRSIITSLAGQRDIVLLYLVNDPQDFVFKGSLERAKVYGVRTEYLQGILKPEDIQKFVPDAGQRQVYLSGPDGMVRSYKKMLSGMGITKYPIKTDYFSGY